MLVGVYGILYVTVASVFLYTLYKNDISEIKNDIYFHYQTIAENGESYGEGNGIYVVEKDASGELSVYGGEILPAENREEILEVAELILSTEKKSGIVSNYQFENSVVNGTLFIAFTDITDVMQRLSYMALGGAIGFVACLLFWTLFSVWLSGKLVRPVEEGILRQNEFMIMAGHELKTPLSVIKSSLEMIKKRGFDEKYLDYALEESDRMNVLVHEILELSGIEENGTAGANLKLDDYSYCVKGAALVFEASAFEKNILYEMDIQEHIRACFDEKLTARIVGIFIDNALHHTSEGKKVIVSLKKEESGPRKEAVLRVSNEGKEIPKEELDKIFDRFYRVDKSGNRKEGRYGLGLSIANAASGAQKGRIEVVSEGGVTTFCFKIKSI